MTNEKMLEYAVTAKHLIDRVEFADAALLLANLQTILKEEIRHDCQKAKGLAHRDKLATAVYESAPEKKPLLKGWHQSKDGKKVIVDGFRAYATDEDFGLPKAPEQLDCVNYLIPSRGQPVTLHLDQAELKVHIKTQKAEIKAWNATHRHDRKKIEPIIFDTGSFSIGFNAQYLLEFCQFFNTDEVQVVDPLSPCWYKDPENGDWGVVLPVRIKKNV